MFAIIKNFLNDILTWGERTLKFYEGYYLVDTVDAKLDMDYITNGIDIL